jgi:hypothetical protein
MNNELVNNNHDTSFHLRMLEIQIQLTSKELLILTEKIDRLERSRQQTIKEMEWLRKEMSILDGIRPRDEIFVLGGRENYP